MQLLLIVFIAVLLVYFAATAVIDHYFYRKREHAEWTAEHLEHLAGQYLRRLQIGALEALGQHLDTILALLGDQPSGPLTSYVIRRLQEQLKANATSNRKDPS